MSNEEILNEIKTIVEEMSKSNTFDSGYQKHKLSDGSEVALIKKEDEIFVFPVTDTVQITYKNSNMTAKVGEPRIPNEKEQRQWLIDRLRYYYFSNRSEFNRSTYYSLKGMTRSGNIESVLRYLESKWDIDIRKDFDSMCKSKTIIPITTEITFINPTKFFSIDIEIPKEVAN